MLYIYMTTYSIPTNTAVFKLNTDTFTSNLQQAKFNTLRTSVQ